MHLLREITVGDGPDERAVGLYRGDLTRLDDAGGVDILIISAAPDDYRPIPGTMVAGLEERGVSVAQLAETATDDLTPDHTCWLSQPVEPDIGFERLMCFEAQRRGSPPEAVDDIFEALNTVLLGSMVETTAAMSVPATGNQGWPVEEVMRPLLHSAVQWLRIGLPLKRLMVVVRSETAATRLVRVFDEYAAEHGSRIGTLPRSSAPGPPGPMPPAAPAPMPGGPPAPAPATAPPMEQPPDAAPAALFRFWRRRGRRRPSTTDRKPAPDSTPAPEAAPPAVDDPGPFAPPRVPARPDVFVSYAHANETSAWDIVDRLRALRPDLAVFIDRDELGVGDDWVERLAGVLDSCSSVIAIYSPEYFASRWCKKELQTALIKELHGEDRLVYPVYLRTADIPTLYLTMQHVDCREGEEDKIATGAQHLANRLSR